MNIVEELKRFTKVYSGRIAEVIQMALYKIKDQDEEIKKLKELLSLASEDLKKWNDYEHNIASKQVYSHIEEYLKADKA